VRVIAKLRLLSMKNQTQQPTPTSQEQTESKAEVIKLGIDIHKRQYVVVQQVDGEAPKSPQKFTPEAFLFHFSRYQWDRLQLTPPPKERNECHPSYGKRGK